MRGRMLVLHAALPAEPGLDRVRAGREVVRIDGLVSERAQCGDEGDDDRR